MEEGRSDFIILTCKTMGILERFRRRWKDDIRMDLKEIGVNTRNYVDSAQEGVLESPREYGIEPPGFISH